MKPGKNSVKMIQTIIIVPNARNKSYEVNSCFTNLCVKGTKTVKSVKFKINNKLFLMRL